MGLSQRSLATLLGVIGLVGPGVRAARACGGGLVNVAAAAVSADRQRIFLSVHAATTDVISEVSVPATTSDYAVLLPVVGMPTLDPQPVPSTELDALDQNTVPRVYLSQTDGDAGCACARADNASKGAIARDMEVSPPIQIGPVTAAVLTAETGDGVAGWLANSGFSLPPGGAALIDAYAGAGRSFIALRRADSAAPGGPTSVGVHFTLPGDARALPLRFARLGASPQVSFTVFVAAPTPVAPALPFAALTLNDLDAAALRAGGYGTTLAAAVRAHGDQAFVIENVLMSSALAAGVFPNVAKLIDPAASLTRLSTSMAGTALTTDVAFTEPFTGEAPATRFVEAREPGPARKPGGRLLGATFVVGLALLRRRRNRG